MVALLKLIMSNKEEEKNLMVLLGYFEDLIEGGLDVSNERYANQVSHFSILQDIRKSSKSAQIVSKTKSILDTLQIRKG